MITIDFNKKIDVSAVGSWSNFDHLFEVEKLPVVGETIRIVSPIENISSVYRGGCAPNIVAASATLGGKTALISVVGQDFLDSGHYKKYEEFGIDLNGLIIVNDSSCGHSLIFTDKNGDAVTFSHLGVADIQDSYEPSKHVIQNSKIVVITYRFDKFTLKAAHYAIESGAFVIISGSLSTTHDLAKDFLDVASALVCNEYELNLLINDLDCSNKNDFFRNQNRVVVETCGKKGSIIHTMEGDEIIPATLSNNYVCAVGAGDGFVGGVATALAFGNTLSEAVRLGSIVASFVVETIGSQENLPTYSVAIERQEASKD